MPILLAHSHKRYTIGPVVRVIGLKKERSRPDAWIWNAPQPEE